MHISDESTESIIRLVGKDGISNVRAFAGEDMAEGGGAVGSSDKSEEEEDNDEEQVLGVEGDGSEREREERESDGEASDGGGV